METRINISFDVSWSPCHIQLWHALLQQAGYTSGVLVARPGKYIYPAQDSDRLRKTPSTLMFEQWETIKYQGLSSMLEMYNSV